eukprot:scaffold492_cov247-Chaetoceros_neogracile.AAC.8
MSHRSGGNSRWGNRPSDNIANHRPPSQRPAIANENENDTTTSASARVSDDQALEALIASAAQRQEQKDISQKECKRGDDDRNRRANYNNSNSRPAARPNQNNDKRNQQEDDESTNYYQPQSKRQRSKLSKEEEKGDAKYSWGNGDTEDQEDQEEEEKEVQKPNFGLSGALANDDKTGNVYNGVLLKFSEPPEARTPLTRWRLYVFKKAAEIGGKPGNSVGVGGEGEGDLLEVLHISKQSAYLFGREVKVADVAVHHASLSKQHCVLQYRALLDKNDREQRLRCKPYLMDLGSTNGTFINGVRIDDARYYELRKGDVITLGSSTREYVLLTENTTSAEL